MSDIDDLNDQLFQKWDDEVAARRDQLMKAAAIQWYQEDKAAKEGSQAQKDENEVQERKMKKSRAEQKVDPEEIIWRH